MKNLTTTAVAVLILAGCSSSPPKSDSVAAPLPPEIQADKVISRINGLDARPKWLNEEHTFEIKDGEVISLGQTSIPGDDRVEAAVRVSRNNAKAAICSAIEQRLDVLFQNAEEGTAQNSTQARYIGAEACKITTSSIRPGNTYWEKVATTKDSGERVTQFKVFTTVTMPEPELKRAVLEAARKREGKGGLSEDFAKKVDEHWEQFAKGGGQ